LWKVNELYPLWTLCEIIEYNFCSHEEPKNGEEYFFQKIKKE